MAANVNTAAATGDPILASLRQDALTLIAMRPPRDQAPQFSMTAIIAIVLILSSAGLTFGEIVRDIVHYFPHFANAMVAATMAGHQPSFVSWLLRAVRDYDTPFSINLRLRNLDPVYLLPFDAVSALFRPYLNPVLPPPPPVGWFRFLNLPEELRLEIYRIVLQLPKSGIRMVDNSTIPDSYGLNRGEKGIVLIERDMNRYAAIGQLNLLHSAPQPIVYTSAYPLRSHTASTLLDFLRTNKEIYREAQKIFYEINRFVFTSIAQLDSSYTALNAVAPQCVFHLRSISFIYHWCDRDVAPQIFRRLAKIHLKKIGLIMAEYEWNFHLRKDGTLMYPEPRDYPGMSTLCDIKDLDKIYVEGTTCGRIAAYIRQTSTAKQVFRVDMSNGTKVEVFL